MRTLKACPLGEVLQGLQLHQVVRRINTNANPLKNVLKYWDGFRTCYLKAFDLLQQKQKKEAGTILWPEV